MSDNEHDELDYDPAFDELAFIHNLRRFVINSFDHARFHLLQQPDDPRTQHAVNETEDLLRLFERAGLVDRLPESVRCNEANNLTELFGSEQRVSEIFRIKSAATTRTWQDLNNATVDDCIRQPFQGVSGLSMTKRHIVYRKHHGGVQATCQWSHLAHLALKGTHLHSKNEDGDWIHWPEIDDRSGVDLSHLCHVADCINKNHLDFEPWWINLARNCCRYAGYCLGDEVHPGVRPCIFTRTTMAIIAAGPNIPPVVAVPGNYDVPRERHDSPRHRPRRDQEKTPAQLAYGTEERREAQKKSTRTFEDRSAANKKGWRTKKKNKKKKEKEEEKKRRLMGLNNFVDRSHHVMTTSSSLNVEEAQPVGRC